MYTQTESYGHLMVSLGAAFTLATFLLLYYTTIGWVVLIAGRILFFGGFAVLATFERAQERERERFRTSSWLQILVGRVPEHLQLHKITERLHVTLGSLLSLLSAALFHIAGRQPDRAN